MLVCCELLLLLSFFDLHRRRRSKGQGKAKVAMDFSLEALLFGRSGFDAPVAIIELHHVWLMDQLVYSALCDAAQFARAWSGA